MIEIPIPCFNTYYPTEEIMDHTQKKFYLHLENNLKELKYLDVKGNISYLFVYAYKILDNWSQWGFNRISSHLLQLSELYKHEKSFSNYCISWAGDCFLALKEYKEFLKITEFSEVYGTRTHTANLRLNIQKHIESDANPLDVLFLFGGRKTKVIANNPILYKKSLIKIFNEFSSKKSWFKHFNSVGGSQKKYDHRLFNGAPLNTFPFLDFKIQCFYSNEKLTSIVKELSKEAENLVRTQLGLPEIGSGWISETELYHKIKNYFLKTKVIQHGRPTWLGRQHFDIWFPYWNIAIEYHGEQHFKPVDFFGGKETFEKTVKRDKRKEKLSIKNNVELYIVTKDTDQDILIKEIEEYMLKNKAKLEIY